MEPLATRIAAFEAVRDIPYHIAVSGEADWCCATKAAMLQRRLASLGLGSRFSFGTYRWSALGLPSEVTSHLPDDVGWHQWLTVFVPEADAWIDLDSSWDAALGAVLPIARWDGLTSTPLAVPLERRCDEPENREIVARGYEPEGVRRYMDEYRPFLIELNRYLSGVRTRASA